MLYEEFCASTLPEGVTLAGLKVVFDGANGAGYKVGPRTLAALDAEAWRAAVESRVKG